MKFSFGGSTGHYWNQFADKWSMGGEGGKLWTSLTKGWQGLKEDKMFNKWGNEAVNLLPHSKLLGGKEGIEEKSKKFMQGSGKDWYMDKSRKLSPLWEGGLSGTGGSLHQDLLPWMEQTGMRASHHLFGTDLEGYGSKYSGGGNRDYNLAVSEAEDPSLINQGNWTRPGELESFLRREELVNRGVLAHDLTKTQRGRQKVETLA